jgi:spermidine synthase
MGSGSSVEAPTSTGPQERRLVALLVVGLLLTGASGLVYQQLWLRSLSLVFGVSVFAAATAIAAFMGGLALGSHLAGGLADRTRRPLAWYGASEIAVGILALATPATFGVLERVYVALARSLPENLALLTLVRLVLALVVLAVPATMMGASTPLVIAAASRASGRVGERTGALYAANTLGAVIGTVAAGFWMVGEFGMVRSFQIAAAVNIGVGAVTIAWAQRRLERDVSSSATCDTVGATSSSGRPHAPVEAQRAPAPLEAPSRRARRAVLAAFAVSGFSSLALELVWFRALSLYARSSAYGFAAMLACVLAGLALGSAVVTPLLRRRWPWLTILATIQIVAGLAALTSLEALRRSAWLVERIGSIDPETPGGRATLVYAVATVLPTSLLLGAAFPIGVHLWTAGASTGRAIGRFYAVNLTAGITGSLAVGFLVLPAAGSRVTLAILAAGLLASGVALSLHARGPARPVWAAIAVAVFVAGAVVALPRPWDGAVAARYPGRTVVYESEGLQTSVAVLADAAGVRFLHIDGLPNGASAGSMGPEEITVLPLALHPNPRRVLVVGIGTGVTTGAAAAVDDVDTTVAELSEDVLDAARLFEDVNFGVLDRPNLRVHLGDGRNWLLTTDERYDIVTADIMEPRSPGAGALWSKEFWQLARDRLTPDGIMLQWTDSTRSATEFAVIARTFLDVFPNGTLWWNGNYLVGTREPLRLDRDRFEAKVRDRPSLRAMLERHGIATFEQLTALYTNGPDGIRRVAGDGPRLTDDRPLIEYWRSLDLGDERPFDQETLREGSRVTDVIGTG